MRTITTKYKLYEDYDGTIYEVELPLSSRIDVQHVAEELGLPDYLELSNPSLVRALVTVWAALRCPYMDHLFPSLKGKVSKPMPVLLFGGAAVKVHSPTANKPGHALNRGLNDVDFVVRKKDGASFTKLLLSLSDALGTQYMYFATSGDKWFNALRGGKRYRVHGLNGFEGGGLGTCVVDIFCEELPFRHTIRLKEEFERARETLYTIGLENLLLSKLQFIFSVPAEKLAQLEASGQSFRVLPYRYLKGMVVVGMELKDMKDVAVLLIDHEIGEGVEAIDPKVLRNTLEKDKAFAQTVRLNLQNLLDNVDVLKKNGLSPSETEEVAAAATDLLKAIPEVNKQWSKPWWNVYVESPGLEGVR